MVSPTRDTRVAEVSLFRRFVISARVSTISSRTVGGSAYADFGGWWDAHASFQAFGRRVVVSGLFLIGRGL